MKTTRVVEIAVVATGLAGLTLTTVHFNNTDSDWFVLGVASLMVTAVLGMSAYFMRKSHHQDDTFEAGYQAGFYRGQRVKPKVIRLERAREQSSRQ